MILAISYGYEVKAEDDPILALTTQAMEEVNEATMPGAFLVDSLPICEMFELSFCTCLLTKRSALLAFMVTGRRVAENRRCIQEDAGHTQYGDVRFHESADGEQISFCRIAFAHGLSKRNGTASPSFMSYNLERCIPSSTQEHVVTRVGVSLLGGTSILWEEYL